MWLEIDFLFINFLKMKEITRERLESVLKDVESGYRQGVQRSLVVKKWAIKSSVVVKELSSFFIYVYPVKKNFGNFFRDRIRRYQVRSEVTNDSKFQIRLFLKIDDLTKK